MKRSLYVVKQHVQMEESGKWWVERRILAVHTCWKGATTRIKKLKMAVSREHGWRANCPLFKITVGNEIVTAEKTLYFFDIEQIDCNCIKNKNCNYEKRLGTLTRNTYVLQRKYAHQRLADKYYSVSYA